MADYGIKIMKEGKNLNSSNIDGYEFWSKYPPLTFLEKKTETIVVGSSCDLTDPIVLEVPHSYNFIPFVIGSVKKTGGSPTGEHNNRYFMPASTFAGINCDVGQSEFVTFTHRVKVDKVEILYNIKCIIPMVGYACPLSNQTFTVELYFYMWELGSLWPL